MLVLLSQAKASELVSPCLKPTTKVLDCKTVEGNLHVWNGWPPNWRIETRDHKNVYGLAYDDSDSLQLMPVLIRKLAVTKEKQMDGTFKICPLGKITAVGDDERKIEWACLEKDSH